jgi:hypothetical protein
MKKSVAVTNRNRNWYQYILQEGVFEGFILQ